MAFLPLVQDTNGFEVIVISAGSGVIFTPGAGTLEISTSVAGTVTSVGLALPSIFTVSGSPVTTTGTLTGTLATQAANAVFAGPASGAAAAPTFRAVVSADVQTIVGPVWTGAHTFTQGTAVTSIAGSGNYVTAASVDTVLLVQATNSSTGTHALVQFRAINNSGAIAYQGISGSNYADFAAVNSGAAFWLSYLVRAVYGSQDNQNIEFWQNNALLGRFTTTAGNFEIGTAGLKLGTATTQKLGFWNAAPIVQPSGAAQAALTNSTGGTANGVLEALQDPADAPITADALRDDIVLNLLPALRNNFTELYTLLNDGLRAALVLSGQIKGGA